MTEMRNEREIIIGVTGHKGAGKDELTRYLADKHGFTVRSCGDEIRAQLRQELHAEPTIAQQIELGNRGRLESGDVGYWARRVLETARATGMKRIAVNGLRHPDEFKALTALGGSAFTLVGITAPISVRATRLIGRGRKGDPTTLEDFLKLDDADRGIGQPPHGQHVDRTMACTVFENVYNNAGTLEEYWAWIESFHARLTGGA